MKDIYMLGIQGSGKGTQANMIMQKYSNLYSYFESGGILRAIKSTNNALADYINKTINDGNLVGGNFIAGLFETYIHTLQPNTYMLVDSLTRNQEQLTAILPKMKLRSYDYIVLYFELSEEFALKRLSNRRICSSCSKVYNLLTDLSMIKCVCGGDLIIRHDDKPEIIRQRLKNFHSQTMPIIDYFKNLGKVMTIDASLSPNKVFDHIEKIIIN